jgi:hypothetical protein
LGQVLNPVHSAGVATFFLAFLDPTYIEQRFAPRFLRCHPFCDVFLGFSFEVIAQLVVQFLVRCTQRNNDRSLRGIVNNQCSGLIPISPIHTAAPP